MYSAHRGCYVVSADVCRHAAEVVQVSQCIVRAGHAEAVAQIKVSLVDSGGLSLACEAQHAMLALDEMALAEISHVLVR